MSQPEELPPDQKPLEPPKKHRKWLWKFLLFWPALCYAAMVLKQFHVLGKLALLYLPLLGGICGCIAIFSANKSDDSLSTEMKIIRVIFGCISYGFAMFFLFLLGCLGGLASS